MKRVLYILFLCTSLASGQQTLGQLFDLYEREYSGAISNSDVNINPNLGFASANPQQEFYRSADSFEGEHLMWRATGDITHFNRMKSWIDQMEDDAVTVSSGGQNYLGWPSTSQCPGGGATEIDRCANGTPLWEFFIGRYVAALLKDIHHSPTFKAQLETDYPGWFNGRVQWWQTNVLEKWYYNTAQNGGSVGDNVYRNRTHISTEAAEMALNLWAVNGNALNKEIWDGIMTTTGMPALSNHVGENMRDQLVLNSGQNLYEWSDEWGQTVANAPQDLNHWGHMVSALVTGFELSQEFTVTDLVRLANTSERLVTSYTNYTFYRNVNLTGGTGSNGALSTQLLMRIAQWNTTFQNGLADNADRNDANRATYAAPLYYNQYMILNDRPIYPEHWVPVDGAFGGTSTPQVNDSPPVSRLILLILEHFT